MGVSTWLSERLRGELRPEDSIDDQPPDVRLVLREAIRDELHRQLDGWTWDFSIAVDTHDGVYEHIEERNLSTAILDALDPYLRKEPLWRRGRRILRRIAWWHYLHPIQSRKQRLQRRPAVASRAKRLHA